MKVGDLVCILAGKYESEIGIIYKFDLDNDPVVYYLTKRRRRVPGRLFRSKPYYRHDVEVISESKSRRFG